MEEEEEIYINTHAPTIKPRRQSPRLQQRGDMKWNMYLYPTGGQKKNQVPNFFLLIFYLNSEPKSYISDI